MLGRIKMKEELIRLNKFLSEAGVCSRREADRLIEAGKVFVDGRRAETGMRVSPAQEIKVGKKVIHKGNEMVLLAVNKPAGIVCTEEKKEKHTTQPEMGHFKKAGVAPQRHLAEFKNFETEYKLGDVITVDFLEDAGFVDVVGTSKGKGFQGVVKRHGFGGVGQTTHGQHNRARKPGSIGACSYPAKVFKGMRMGGQLGGDRVTVQNLQVLKVIADHNLLLIKGSIPGCKGSIVIIEK